MPDLHQAFEGKTELFQKKVPKKGPKTGSGGMLLLGTISQFFRDFPGFPKIQVEMPRAGKGGGPAHMRFVKITQICYVHTNTH